MSELSQQHLRALGLVETNVVRLDKALKDFHSAIMQMDLDQMRIFAKTDLAQQAYALVNTYAQMDEGLQTVGRPYFKEPSAQDGLVCDGCGATTDDFEMPFNANLSINKMHRSLCPSALSCSGTLRPQALRSGPIPTEVSGLQYSTVKETLTEDKQMLYKRTFGNGEELKITDNSVTIGGRKVSTMLQNVGQNNKGIVKAIDGKYGLTQVDLNALNEYNEIIANRPMKEKELNAYYKHHDTVERIR